MEQFTPMESSTHDVSVDPVVPSPSVPTPIHSEQKPKRSFRVHKFIAVIIGLAAIVALFAGYVVYVSPFPLIVIPMKILGLKLGYNFYNDPRNLVYFLYPKEGKVVLEANGTVVWKNVDENGDNAVVIIQPAKVPMPSNGCTELEKNTWECSDYATENNSSITSYYKKIFDTLYMINYGTKSSGRLQHANVRDDIFFTRVLQSLLISPIQAPVIGNVEFLGYKIKLRDGWNVQSRLLEVEDLYFNDVISHVDVINNEYTILLSGGWGTARAPCISDSFYSEDGKYIVHDKEMTISDDIYRLDIVGISNRQRYSTKKRNKSSYEFELCQGNTQGGDDHESGTNIGQIEYNIPENFDPKVLEEMDGIIRDLAKKSEGSRSDLVSTPLADVTASWNTYKSEFYKYQFNYPSDWKVSETGSYGKEPGGYTELNLQAPRNQEEIDKQKQARYSDMYYSFLSFMPDFPKTGFSPIDGASASGFIKATREAKVIAGKNSTVFHAETVATPEEPSMWGPKGSKYIFSYIDMGDNFLFVEYSVSDSYPEIYNQIISTLKFY